jgi:hypothetical protein
MSTGEGGAATSDHLERTTSSTGSCALWAAKPAMCGSRTLREIEEENDAGKRHVLAEPVEALRLARVGEGAVAVNGECGECQGWGGCAVDIDGEHGGRRGRGRVTETVDGERSARSGRG